MSNGMGELPKDASYILDNPHGTPRTPSPFFGKKPEAKVPSGLEWLHDYKEEVVDAAVDAAARRVYKTRPPHWIQPPFSHVIIDRLTRVNVPALAVNQVILTLTIAQNQMARIKFYGQDIQPVPPAALPATAWQDIVWTFRVNGVPLIDYGRFTSQRGAPILPAETTIILQDSDTFEVVVDNVNAAAAYWVFSMIRGWSWSTLSTNIPKEDILNFD